MAKSISDKDRGELIEHIGHLQSALRTTQAELRHAMKALSDEKQRHVRLFTAKQAAEKMYLRSEDQVRIAQNANLKKDARHKL